MILINGKVKLIFPFFLIARRSRRDSPCNLVTLFNFSIFEPIPREMLSASKAILFSAICFFLAIDSVVYGQGEFLHLRYSVDEVSEYYELESVRKLTYTSATLLVHFNEGEPLEVPLEGLEYFNYQAPSLVDESDVHQLKAALNVFPNPATSTVRVSYELEQDSDVLIVIYDASGREAETLQNAHLPAGFYELVWDVSSHSSGAYICRLVAGNQSITKRILVLP